MDDDAIDGGKPKSAAINIGGGDVVDYNALKKQKEIGDENKDGTQTWDNDDGELFKAEKQEEAKVVEAAPQEAPKKKDASNIEFGKPMFGGGGSGLPKFMNKTKNAANLNQEEFPDLGDSLPEPKEKGKISD